MQIGQTKLNPEERQDLGMTRVCIEEELETDQ